MRILFQYLVSKGGQENEDDRKGNYGGKRDIYISLVRSPCICLFFLPPPPPPSFLSFILSRPPFFMTEVSSFLNEGHISRVRNGIEKKKKG